MSSYLKAESRADVGKVSGDKEEYLSMLSGRGSGVEGTSKVASKAGNITELNEVNYGDHFTKKGKRRRKELTPNVRYVTEAGYKYTTDDLGRIVDVEANNLILKEADRNVGMQRATGREDRVPDDDGGHLIGRQFHRSGDIDNLVA